MSKVCTAPHIAQWGHCSMQNFAIRYEISKYGVLKTHNLFVWRLYWHEVVRIHCHSLMQVQLTIVSLHKTGGAQACRAIYGASVARALLPLAVHAGAFGAASQAPGGPAGLRPGPGDPDPPAFAAAGSAGTGAGGSGPGGAVASAADAPSAPCMPDVGAGSPYGDGLGTDEGPQFIAEVGS